VPDSHRLPFPAARFIAARGYPDQMSVSNILKGG